MQRFRKLQPRSNMNPQDHRLFRELNNVISEANAAIASLSRGRTADQAQVPVTELPPNITDHGDLTGLVPILDTSLNITDMNDDHSQYALLFGRPGGQELFGSRGAASSAWVPSGTFSLAFNDGTTGNGTLATNTWSGVSVDVLATATTGVFIALSTHSANSLAGGSTNYHTAFADSAGNTWTKLGEYSYNRGVACEHISVWFSLLTNTMTPGTTTMSATFSTNDHGRASMESYKFAMSAGQSVTAVAFNTPLTNNAIDFTAPAPFPSVTISAQSGETLYLRASAVQPNSGGAHVKVFTPTSGFTAFASDHTDSVNTGAFAFSQTCRAEFRVLTDQGATSSPLADPTVEQYFVSTLFVAVQISASVTGYLLLGAANLAQAALIELNGKTTKLNFDQLLFRGPGSTTTLSYVSGTDGCFHGITEHYDNVGAFFGDARDAEFYYDGTNLICNPSLVGTGSLKLFPTVNSNGSYTARQHILQVAHPTLVGGTSNTTAQTLTLGTGLLTDAGLASGQYGMVQGLDLTVTNTNTTKTGLPKGAVAPYVLNLTMNAEMATTFSGLFTDYAALKITSAYTGSNTQLTTALLAIVTGNNTSTAALTGVQGCQFKATNSSSAGGDARGFLGYGDTSSASSTGRGIGVYGYGSNSGNGANAQSISFFCNTIGPADSRQHYDIIGTKHAIHGALYITTATTNLKTSNPATHLTPPTGTLVPTSDLFVDDHAEIDDTLWLDKVGDALVFAEGGNIVLGTSTGTQLGTSSSQKLGFWGKTPIVRPAAYTPTNVTTDRAYDADATSIDELADVLGTLIADLQSAGLIG